MNIILFEAGSLNLKIHCGLSANQKSHSELNINKHYAENRNHNVILSRGISYVLSVCGLSSYLATTEVS